MKTPYENIKIVEEKLNRRLERLFEQIELADEINIYWGCTKHRFIQLDKKVFSLFKSVVRKNLLSTFSLWKKKKSSFMKFKAGEKNNLFLLINYYDDSLFFFMMVWNH